LRKRHKIVREIARLKAETDCKEFRHGRINEVMAYAGELALEHNLDPKVIRHIYTIIMGYSRKIMDGIRS